MANAQRSSHNNDRTEQPPVSIPRVLYRNNETSYFNLRAVHTVLPHPAGFHYQAPSSNLPIASIEALAHPIVFVQTPGPSTRTLRFLVDTGSEKCLVYSSCLTASTPVYPVPKFHINGIGGPRDIKSKAWLELQMLGQDKDTSEIIEFKMAFLADVVETRTQFDRAKDGIIGMPALLPFEAKIKLGDRRAGTAALILRVPKASEAKMRVGPETRTDDPGRYIPEGFVPLKDAARKPAARPLDGTAAWYSMDVRPAPGEFRKISVPLAFCQNYSGGESQPVVVENWYDRTGRASMRWHVEDNADT